MALAQSEATFAARLEEQALAQHDIVTMFTKDMEGVAGAPRLLNGHPVDQHRWSHPVLLKDIETNATASFWARLSRVLFGLVHRSRGTFRKQFGTFMLFFSFNASLPFIFFMFEIENAYDAFVSHIVEGGLRYLSHARPVAVSSLYFLSIRIPAWPLTVFCPAWYLRRD